MESYFCRCHVRIINASSGRTSAQKHNRASLCVTLNHRETVDEKTPNQPRPLINMLRLNGHYKRGCFFAKMLRERGKSSAGYRPVITARQGCSVISQSKPNFRVNAGLVRGRLNVVRKLLSRRLSFSPHSVHCNIIIPRRKKESTKRNNKTWLTNYRLERRDWMGNKQRVAALLGRRARTSFRIPCIISIPSFVTLPIEFQIRPKSVFNSEMFSFF